MLLEHIVVGFCANFSDPADTKQIIAGGV